MSPQCVSCNNQPNDNDSLGGAASEGTVTPVVIGIIVGTVGVFVLVLCALFYCVKLENERSLRVKDDVGEELEESHEHAHAHAHAHAFGVGGTGEEGSVAAAVNDGDNGGNNILGDDDGRVKPVGLGRGRRASGGNVGGGGEGPRDGAVTMLAGVVVGKRRGLFGWGGKKGGGAPADNLPVTAIEMV